MYTCLKIHFYIDLKLDCISLSICSYNIKLLFAACWWYQQFICSKSLENCEEVKHFSHGFTICRKRIN